MESGVSVVLPAYLWPADQFWKGLRSDVPWCRILRVDRGRDRVRLTLQPFSNAPRKMAGINRLMDHIFSDRCLLFSPTKSALRFDETPPCRMYRSRRAKKIMADNPLGTYARCQPHTAPMDAFP